MKCCPSCGAVAWGNAYCWLCVLHWHYVSWETRLVLLRNNARRSSS